MGNTASSASPSDYRGIVSAETLRLYCPVCKRYVNAVPSEAWYVCPSCGYVFTDHPVIDDTMQYMYTSTGDVIRTHTPFIDSTAHSAYRRLHASFKADRVKQLEVVKQCIHKQVGSTTVGKRRLARRWLIELVLQLIEEHPDKKLSRKALLERVGSDKNKQKVATALLMFICDRCVECVP